MTTVRKLLAVVGARPQFIKAAMVSRVLAEHNRTHPDAPVTEILVHTGQHFDTSMSDVFFDELDMPEPAYHLGIGGLGHAAMTGRMTERIDEVIAHEQPDAVLVYGDTNSTLAGALAAAKRHVPIGHVEAGVRSFNRRMPEEINRILTDRIARWLFCPSSTAVQNLADEGIRDSHEVRVVDVGDVMADALRLYRDRARPTDAIALLLKDLGTDYYVATVHREENTDDALGDGRLGRIVAALETIARTTPVVMPLHPRTRRFLSNLSVRHIRMLEPVGYFDMLTLVSSCRGVLTDSGGLQKEAYYLGKPCITLRDETEWVELVDHRFNVVVGADPGRILQAERAIREGQIRVRDIGLYGAGDTSHRIVETLTTFS
jgi:UDP-GlcNAc3NAcA epimerase